MERWNGADHEPKLSWAPLIILIHHISFPSCPSILGINVTEYIMKLRRHQVHQAARHEKQKRASEIDLTDHPLWL